MEIEDKMPKKPIKDKTLLIIESPGKLSTLNKILGDSYFIRASFGHIMELSKTRGNGLGVEVDNDFKVHYSYLPDKKDKIQALLDAASNAKEILIASDGDSEGECIAFHLRDTVISSGVPIKRVIFNEITKSAVLKAINNPIEFNEPLYLSQNSRRVTDRLIGFLVSPFLIKAFNGEKLSAGRVQSVAVRLVNERENEIETFEPEEYWNIFATLAKNTSEQNFTAKYIKKITSREDAVKIKDELESDDFSVVYVDAKEKKRNPYPPLTTSKLQQIAAGRYGLSVKTIMDAAQKLYEGGHISYMRTDSVHTSPEAITEVRSWLKNNSYKIPNQPNFYASKANAANAHECCRPTHIDNLPEDIFVPEDQKKVYRVIWERFVASQMEPALYDTVSILIKSSSGHELKVSGRTLKYAGWLDIATDQISVKSEDEDDIQLPILKSGDNLILVAPKVKAEQKFTQPPPRYGEAILVKELEKRGIGRPSTYATILETIKSRGYVELKGKVYHGTEIGAKVTNKLKKYFKFLEYDYTANMETQLDEIAEGKLKYVDMLNSFFKDFQRELRTAYNDSNTDASTDILCNKCGKFNYIIKHGQYGYYLSCFDVDCKSTISCELVDGKPVLKEKNTVFDGVSCPKCSGKMTKRDGKFGPYLSCLDIKCKGNAKVPYGKKCPKCNKELYQTIYQDQNVLFCTGYPNCFHREDLKNTIENPKNYSSGQDIPRKTKKILKSVSKK